MDQYYLFSKRTFKVAIRGWTCFSSLNFEGSQKARSLDETSFFSIMNLRLGKPGPTEGEN
jgi:hypothetical protein